MSAVACGSAFALALPAHAESAQLSEVIVTARKRQESILNVPVIETALPQERLQRLQTRDIKDISTLVPGLSFGVGNGQTGVQLSLRGVGTTSSDPAIENSVSLNIDGMQMSQGLAFMSGLFDVGQVEVLKGPQSLFYGKSSPGGVISMRTADPTSQRELIARAMYEFESREKRAELIVSGPITDSLKVRVAGMYTQEDGYFHNIAIGQVSTGGKTPDSDRVSPAKRYALRTTVLWQPTAAFSSRLKVSLNHDRQIISAPLQLVSCPDGTAPVTFQFIAPNENCKLDRNVTVVQMDPAAFPTSWNHGVPFLDTTQKYGSLELNWNIRPDITLTSVSGYYHVRSDSLTNANFSGFAGPSFLAQTVFHRVDKTEEVRLNTDFSSPFNLTAGLFYQDGTFSFTTDVDGNTLEKLPVRLSYYTDHIAVKLLSPFAQLRWKVTPQVEVALGARYSDEKRQLIAINRVSGADVIVNPTIPKVRSKTTQPELTVTYKPMDNVTIFGSLKKGYKSGSFNTGVVPANNADISFGDERIKGGELGFKSRLLDHSLALDVAAFDYHLSGLQVGIIQPTLNGSPPGSKVVNAGSAQTYGVDFSATYRPPQAEDLTFHVNGQWNRAKFNSLLNVPCWGGQEVSEGCNQQFFAGTGRFNAQDLSNTPLPRAPRWQVNFGADYERPLADGRTIVLSNNNAYSSRYIMFPGNRADFYQSSFMKVDLSAMIRGPRDTWELAIIGKNITDKLTLGSCSNSNSGNGVLLGGEITGGTTRGPAGIDEVGCRIDRGREVWVRLTLKPFA